LNAVGVKSKKTPGYYCDGGGLYLQIAKGGSKSWIFRYTLKGKTREMGLGSLNAVTLAQARDKARELRFVRTQGLD
ncbi:MAG: Arm DNA-binding domain-containing protein, partial [Burkholderiales bacterium]